jgi:hypothetical protein
MQWFLQRMQNAQCMILGMFPCEVMVIPKKEPKPVTRFDLIGKCNEALAQPVTSA